MPFTVSHAAVALAFRHQRNVSPLLIALGAMSPDIPYFILRISYGLGTLSHRPHGLVLVGLPLATLLYVILRGFSGEIERFTGWKIPDFDWSGSSLKRAGVFAANIVFGGFTHLVLDSFTHHNGPVVVLFSWLREEVSGLPTYTWLQILSSGLLLGWLAGAYLKHLWARWGTLAEARRHAMIHFTNGAAAANLLLFMRCRLRRNL